MSRATPYQAKPSIDWMQSYQTLMDGRKLFLIARTGPTVFSVRDENNQTYKVILGNPNTCQCTPNGVCCVHILYCLIKVLKITKDHPLCYQTSLTDSELDMILSGQCCARLPKRAIQPFLKRSSASGQISSDWGDKDGDEGDSGFVRRRLLAEEEEEPTCPICCDDMAENQALTWCRIGCGKNLHAKCMFVYSQQITNVLCPLCRSPWEMELLKKDMKSTKPNKFSPVAVVMCTLCTCLQRRLFHRCIECSQKNFYIGQTQSADGSSTLKPVDYCLDCFRSRLHDLHRNHHFLSSDASIENAYDVTWCTVKNPLSQIVDTHQLQSLQNREFTAEDYELLRSFDRKDAGDFTTVLLSALPSISIDTINGNPLKHGTKCFCGSGTDDGSSNFEQNCFLKMPCNHFAHKHCLQQHVNMIINEDDISKVCNYRCSHEGCGKLIFGGLRRKQVRAKKIYSDGSKEKPKIPDNNGQTTIGMLTNSLRSHSANPVLVGSSIMGVSGRGLASESNQSESTINQPSAQIRRPPRRRPPLEAQQDHMVAPINRPVPSIPRQHRLIGRNDNDDNTTERFTTDEGGYRYRLTRPPSVRNTSPAVNVGQLLAQNIQQEHEVLNSGPMTIGGTGIAAGNQFNLPNRAGGATSSKLLMKRNPAGIGKLRSHAAGNLQDEYAGEPNSSLLASNSLGLNEGLTYFSYHNNKTSGHNGDPSPMVSSRSDVASNVPPYLPRSKMRLEHDNVNSNIALGSSRSTHSIGIHSETPAEMASLVLEVGLGGTALTNNGKTNRGPAVVRVGRRAHQSNVNKLMRQYGTERLHHDRISESDIDEMIQVNHYDS